MSDTLNIISGLFQVTPEWVKILLSSLVFTYLTIKLGNRSLNIDRLKCPFVAALESWFLITCILRLFLGTERGARGVTSGASILDMAMPLAVLFVFFVSSMLVYQIIARVLSEKDP
jgi:hypothetical protein